ncbi:LuxR family transcriptional regulator [Cryobacterium sp. TMS1-13-1]|uniref:helix-turn-helix transcriptional regulator n=1 Tax=Cryobacterium sp. TMS1-13-1 TaxID=1259220 RepID=UPI00106B989E|nr:LuxR family transcriptional regulator [Cryobacterium sp. TMS1-13-1]TFD23363.1 helix-turn-helix transcriptional regulator [Cryobacterium sp. TMS1-13-1]
MNDDDVVPRIFGRSTELAQLARLLRSADDARVPLAVMTGPRGSGRSALVDEFIRQSGASLFRASGVSWEQNIPWGILDQLLGGRAWSEGEAASTPDTAGEAVLSALGTCAEDRDVVLFVDDVDYADDESVQALLYLVRRLRRDRVLIILTVEVGHPLSPVTTRLVQLSGCTQTILGPLDTADIQRLALASGRIDLPTSTAHRLGLHTAGNPRHILQLLTEHPPRFWSEWQHVLPAPRQFAGETLERLTRASADARALVEAAAVLGVDAVFASAVALAGTRVPMEALDQARTAGFLKTSGDDTFFRISFSSALMRAAVYESLGPVRRTALHRAASRLVPGHGDRLTHRAASTAVPDAALAAEIEQFAVSQTEVGAWEPAAENFLQAARLWPTRAERERRLLCGIDALVGAGDVPRALSYIDEIESFSRGPLRDSVQGYLAVLRGRQVQAERLLVEAWDQCDPQADASTTATVAQRLVLHSLAKWHGPDLVEWAQRSTNLVEEDIPAAVESRAMIGLGLAALGKTAEATAFYHQMTVGNAVGAQSQRMRLGKGWLQLAMDEPELARDELTIAVPTAYNYGSLRISLWAQAWKARAEFTLGSWDDALRTVARASIDQESSHIDLTRPLLHWTASQVFALRGDLERASAHRRLAAATAEDYPVMQIPSCLAVAQVAEIQADYDGVIRALTPMLRLDRSHGIDEPGFWPWQDVYANALVMVNRVDEAGDFLRPLERLADKRRHRSTIARLAYVRGRILSAKDEIEEARGVFEQGLVALEGLPMPFLRARVHFAYGQSLRRAGKRRDAAPQLSTARDIFSSLGAIPYVRRCDRELLAGGLNVARREGGDLAALTAQEQAVTGLVASGKTNKQTAAELNVTGKTVQYHLTNIYSKMSISSRSELAARFGEGAAD